MEKKHWPFELAVAYFSLFGVKQQMVLVLEPPLIMCVSKFVHECILKCNVVVHILTDGLPQSLDAIKISLTQLNPTHSFIFLFVCSFIHSHSAFILHKTWRPSMNKAKGVNVAYLEVRKTHNKRDSAQKKHKWLPVVLYPTLLTPWLRQNNRVSLASPIINLCICYFCTAISEL